MEIKNFKLKIKPQSGFTFIEVLVVMAIFAFLAGVGLFLSIDVFRSSLFRADADIIASALQRARSQAINNINESRHGVYIETSGYTIFEGDNYATRDVSKDIILSIGSGFSFTPSAPIEIVFEQLSGDASFNGDIVIAKDAKTTTVNMNNEGRINY